MFSSKPLKDFPEEKRSNKLYLWWIQTPVADKYYEFVHKFITNPIYQVKRLCQWYWNVFRFDYDFDGHCLFAIIEYKLKRLEKVLENGHAVQTDQGMHALKLAIKLAGRLKEEKYEQAFWNRHDRKWGEMKTWFEDTGDGSGNSYWLSSRPKAQTEEQKEQKRLEHIAYIYAAEAQQKREEKWLYGILEKYLRSWWD